MVCNLKVILRTVINFFFFNFEYVNVYNYKIFRKKLNITLNFHVKEIDFKNSIQNNFSNIRNNCKNCLFCFNLEPLSVL